MMSNFWDGAMSPWQEDEAVNSEGVFEVQEIVPLNRNSDSAVHNPDIQIPAVTSPPPQTSSFSPSTERKMAALRDTDLYSRDRESIEYTKSLLEDGDTLVFIKYPGDINVYDPTGSHLKPQSHRVHSQKLLATGSSKFTKLLSDDWKQHLMRKRNGFLNKDALPSGVTYVLDLTPPDEGDEAVDLTSDLSCSVGVRNWYSSVQRCGVHKNMVGGNDDICRPKSFSAAIKQSTAKPVDNTVPPAVIDDNFVDEDKSAPSPSPQHDPIESFEDRELFNLNESNLQKALERSRKEQHQRPVTESQYDPDSKDKTIASEVVEEYCPIRHRAGIQGLLQLIEGKEPKLDSAPKVWTLVGISKYFECTDIVVDFILRWMLAEPNTQFIETLPEASYSIGKNLHNTIITRPAFAILVSEEALNLASRMNKVDPNRAIPSRSQAREKSTSRFGRPMEYIDDDSLTAVQAAATDFQSRIQRVVDDLIGPEMKWFDNLPEFAKLSHFEGTNKSDYQFNIAIEELVADLRHYVRVELLSVFALRLPDDLATEASAHRKAENYHHHDWENHIQNNLRVIYLNFSDSEKIMTRFYWHMLKNLTWETMNKRNYLFDFHQGAQHLRNTTIIEKYNLFPPATMDRLFHCQHKVNEFIRRSEDAKSTNDNPFDYAGEETVQRKHTKDRSPLNSASSATKEFGTVESVVRKLRLSQEHGETSWPEEDLDFSYSYQKSRQSHVLSGSGIPGPASPRKEKRETPESPVLGNIASWGLPIRQRRTSLQQKSEPYADDFGKIDPVTFQSNYPPSFNGQPTRYYPVDLPTLAPAVFTPSLEKKIPKQNQAKNIESPYFSVGELMTQVSGYIRSLATNMLSNSEVDFRTLTDTLLCLTHNEFKYLPLWADGDDDGTGGVFDPSLPPASMGPIGPGPSYHTGFSVNSRASTEMDWEGSSVDTSIAVENGFSDHIDRRVVDSDDGFRSSTTGSVVFSYDSEDYGDAKDNIKGKAVEHDVDIKGKGKAVERELEQDEYMVDDDDVGDFESFSEDESWADDDGQI